MTDNNNNLETEKLIGGNKPEPLDNLVCDVCFEANLTTNVHIQTCVGCDQSYCRHHASIVDPANCNECLSDVSMTIETIQKTEIHESKLEPGKVFTRSRKARQIKIGGLHWLFIQRQIPTLNDAELALDIEYHRALYGSMIFEREKRRNETFHRNASKTFKLPTSSVTSTTTVKKSKVTKVLKPDKAATNLAAYLEVLQKSGMDLNQIAALLKGKK